MFFRHSLERDWQCVIFSDLRCFQRKIRGFRLYFKRKKYACVLLTKQKDEGNLSRWWNICFFVMGSPLPVTDKIMEFTNVSERCLRIHFDIRNLMPRIRKNSAKFRESFEVPNFDPSHFVNNTDPYSVHFSLRTWKFFVIPERKYQTCLIFGSSDKSDKNTEIFFAHWWFGRSCLSRYHKCALKFASVRQA